MTKNQDRNLIVGLDIGTCEHLLRMEDPTKPLVLISKKATRGGTEVFVYTKDQPALFATVVAELDRRNFNVHDAQIMTSKDGHVIDTFMVLDQHGEAIDESRHAAVIKHLTHVLEAGHRSTDKRYSGDNRLIPPKSSYRRRCLAPRCRLITSWG